MYQPLQMFMAGVKMHKLRQYQTWRACWVWAPRCWIVWACLSSAVGSWPNLTQPKDGHPMVNSKLQGYTPPERVDHWVDDVDHLWVMAARPTVVNSCLYKLIWSTVLRHWPCENVPPLTNQVFSHTYINQWEASFFTHLGRGGWEGWG